MARAGRLVVLALVAAALLWPLARRQDQPSLPQVARCEGALSLPRRGNVDEIRAATLCLLNQERAREDLPPLRRNRRLERASQSHSETMAERRFFAHEDHRGADAAARVRRAGYRGATVGENIGWGAERAARPAEMVAGWMNSPGHRRNILERRFREIGIGVVTGAPEPVPGQRAAIYTTDFGA